MTDKELKNICNEMLYQITGFHIEKEDQCEEQGHPDWQTAMHFLRKASGVKPPQKVVVTIEVREDEIDALENYCTKHYSSSEDKLYDRQKVLDVWGKIVHQVEKPLEAPEPANIPNNDGCDENSSRCTLTLEDLGVRVYRPGVDFRVSLSLNCGNYPENGDILACRFNSAYQVRVMSHYYDSAAGTFLYDLELVNVEDVDSIAIYLDGEAIWILEK